MNKSEKERLALIISEMKTSYSSSPDVALWGEKLLAEFTGVSSFVEQFDEVQNIDNVANAYNSYIVEMSSSCSMRESTDYQISKMGINGTEGLYHAFDSYFCRDRSISLQRVEESLGGDKIKAKLMVKQLLNDDEFILLLNKSEDLTADQKELFTGCLLNPSNSL
ncbi:hypothetical protein L1267_17800 [Pseudoalteromonas sp. OFAV1]|uniref:hypothetical protein n=1 Tax=Pseudoalteromonas sp. OFAV1 TaxID=2908892 RepID=UPI001F34B808|nr:hypothetical protein [Pseudoalteromonas sp. OFAV1]MCF2902226.1 hypothetical protein [Pseudoalteromonas sp. OFAV1]